MADRHATSRSNKAKLEPVREAVKRLGGRREKPGPEGPAMKPPRVAKDTGKT